jgi:hypothetical protein
LHLDLQLSESRQITAQCRTEPLIRLDHELLATLGSHDQGLPIRAESDQSCGAHPSRWLLVRFVPVNLLCLTEELREALDASAICKPSQLGSGRTVGPCMSLFTGSLLRAVSSGSLDM